MELWTCIARSIKYQSAMYLGVHVQVGYGSQCV